MKYSKFEKLGISTSLLGFGCMRFPLTAEGKIDEPRAAAMLHRVRICVPYSKGQLVSRIHEQGNVISEEYDAEGTVIIATLDQIALDRISRELPVGGVELLGAKS